MIDNSAYNDKIDQFLKGKMTPEEELLFKAEIGNNPELKQLVREHLYLIRGIKQVKAQEEKTILSNTRSITPLRRNWIKISGIAATIAVVLVLSGIGGTNLYYRHELRQFAYNASFEVMSDFTNASRGTIDEDTKAHLTDLFTNAQEGKDLPETIAELSQLYALTKDDFVDIEDDYAYQIGWFLAVAYINNKDYEKALEIISNLESEYPDNGQLKTLQNGILNIL